MEKIAFVTDNGDTISQHFGRAGKYLVISIENSKVQDRDLRDKMGHHHFQSNDTPEEHGEGHGFSDQSQKKHVQMLAAIEDCDVVVSGGMGMGAYESIRSAGKKPIITDIVDIDHALDVYLRGELQDLTHKLH